MQNRERMLEATNSIGLPAKDAISIRSLPRAVL
jgi:hypothetical protein